MTSEAAHCRRKKDFSEWVLPSHWTKLPNKNNILTFSPFPYSQLPSLIERLASIVSNTLISPTHFLSLLLSSQPPDQLDTFLGVLFKLHFLIVSHYYVKMDLNIIISNNIPRFTKFNSLSANSLNFLQTQLCCLWSQLSFFLSYPHASYFAMVWMFLSLISPTSIHMLKSGHPKVMVLGSGAFGKWLGPEFSPSWMGWVLLGKVPSTMWGYRESEARKRALFWSFDLGLPTFQTVRKNFCSS